MRGIERRALTLLAAAACSIAPPRGNDTGDPTSSAATTTGTTASPPAATSEADPTRGSSTGADDGSGDGMREDMGSRFDTVPPDTGEETGCEKVDFLFVIDNSGSMGDEQEQLVASFGGFIDTIATTLHAQDYRIMVTDTKGPPCACGTTTCAHPEDPEFHDMCNDLCPQFCGGTGCDVVSGAASHHDLEGEECGFASGETFMTHEEPDLAQAFTCAARMGDNGSPSENPAGAAIAAASGEVDAVDCNGGTFVRDDAVLVVTIVTDEDDRLSAGEPQQWRDALVDVKGGNELAVVTLALIGDSELEDGLCTWDGNTGAEDAPRLREFVAAFGEQGIWASVCEPDYTPFFESAVALIDRACEQFPAG